MRHQELPPFLTIIGQKPILRNQFGMFLFPEVESLHFECDYVNVTEETFENSGGAKGAGLAAIASNKRLTPALRWLPRPAGSFLQGRLTPITLPFGSCFALSNTHEKSAGSQFYD